MEKKWTRVACVVVAIALAGISLLAMETMITRAAMGIVSGIYGVGAIYPKFGQYLFHIIFTRL